ncbi:MAG: hypothetical protein RL885_02705 [Planctomycetota bacterium]
MLGNPATSYPAKSEARRGLESGPAVTTAAGQDRFTISADRRTLRIDRLTTTNDSDQIRVILGDRAR